ncbi:MAG: GNAT family N-acetyltransferase [Candidatus Hodarchaeales archaeon]
MNDSKIVEHFIAKNPDIGMRLFSLLEEQSVAIYSNLSALLVHSWGIGIYAENPEDIVPLLSKIPSDKRLFLNGISKTLLPILQRELTPERIEIIDETNLWTLEEPITDYKPLDSLNLADVEIVNENWAYKSETSISHIEHFIKKYPSSVVRDSSDNPIGWSFCYSSSPHYINMGGLIVIPSHRRRGYGRLITLDLSSKVFLLGKKPLVHVHIANNKSHSLLRQVGFQRGAEIIFGRILPEFSIK